MKPDILSVLTQFSWALWNLNNGICVLRFFCVFLCLYVFKIIFFFMFATFQNTGTLELTKTVYFMASSTLHKDIFLIMQQFLTFIGVNLCLASPSLFSWSKTRHSNLYKMLHWKPIFKLSECIFWRRDKKIYKDKTVNGLIKANKLVNS